MKKRVCFVSNRKSRKKAGRGFVVRGASGALAALALAFGAMVAGASATSTTSTTSTLSASSDSSASAASSTNAIRFSSYAESESAFLEYQPRAARSQAQRPFAETAQQAAGGYFSSLLEDEVGLAAWQEYLHERALGNTEGGNFLEQRKESLKRKLTSLYLSTTQQIVRAGEDFSRASGFVENIDADFTPELGETPWSLGISAIGKIYEYNEKTRAVLWQLRGFGGAEERFGINAGLLYRIATDDGALAGVNTFLDYEETDYGSFWRSSYGVEYRREFFDAYANYYHGITDPIRTNQVDILGDPRFAYTRDGVDVGVNFNIPQYNAGAGAKYYRFDGERGQADDTGLRYNVNMKGGLFGYPQAKVYFAYDVPNEGDSTWGFGLNYTHRLGTAADGKRAADSRTFDPYDYFYTPAIREYSQRIALSGDAGGGVGYRIERRAPVVEFAVGADDLEVLGDDFSRHIPLMSTIRIVTGASGLADLATTRPDLWELQVFNNTDVTYEYEAGVIRLNSDQSGMRFLRDPASETPQVSVVQAGSLTIFLSGTDIEVQRTDRISMVADGQGGQIAVEVVSIVAGGGDITIQHAHVDELLTAGIFGDVINIVVDDTRDKCRTINGEEMCFDEPVEVKIFDDNDFEDSNPTPPISFDGSPRILDEQQQALRTPTRIEPLTPAGAILTLTATGGALQDGTQLGYNITRVGAAHSDFSLAHDGTSSLAIINLSNLNSNTTDQYRNFTVMVDNVDQLGQVPTMLTIPFIFEQTPSLRLTNPTNREISVPFGRPANAIVSLAAAGGAGASVGYSFSIVGSSSDFALGNENGSNDTGSVLSLQNANNDPNAAERVVEVIIRIDSRGSNSGEVADLDITLTITFEAFQAEPLQFTNPGLTQIPFAAPAGSVLVLQASGGAGSEIGYTFEVIDDSGNPHTHPTFVLGNESGGRDIGGEVRLRNPNTTTTANTPVDVTLRVSSTGYTETNVPYITVVVRFNLQPPPPLQFTNPGLTQIPFAQAAGSVLVLSASGGASESTGYTFQIIDSSGSPHNHQYFELADESDSNDTGGELRLKAANTQVDTNTAVEVTLDIDSTAYGTAVDNLTVVLAFNLQAPPALQFAHPNRTIVVPFAQAAGSVLVLSASGGASESGGYVFRIVDNNGNNFTHPYFELGSEGGSNDTNSQLRLRARNEVSSDTLTRVTLDIDSNDYPVAVRNLTVTLTLNLQSPQPLVFEGDTQIPVAFGTSGGTQISMLSVSGGAGAAIGYTFVIESQSEANTFRLANESGSADDGGALVLVSDNERSFSEGNLVVEVVVRADSKTYPNSVEDLLITLNLTLEAFVAGNIVLDNGEDVSVDYGAAAGSVLRTFTASGSGADGFGFNFELINGTPQYVRLATDGNTNDTNSQLQLVADNLDGFLDETITLQVSNRNTDLSIPSITREIYITLQGPARDGNPRFASPSDNQEFTVADGTETGAVVAALEATGGFPAAGNYQYTFEMVDAQGNPASSDYIRLVNSDASDNLAHLELAALYTGEQAILNEVIYVQVGNNPAGSPPVTPTRIRLVFNIEKTSGVQIDTTRVRATFNANATSLGKGVLLVDTSGITDLSGTLPDTVGARHTVYTPYAIATINATGAGSGVQARVLGMPSEFKVAQRTEVEYRVERQWDTSGEPLQDVVLVTTVPDPNTYVFYYDRNSWSGAGETIRGSIEFSGSGIQSAFVDVEINLTDDLEIESISTPRDGAGVVEVNFVANGERQILLSVTFDGNAGKVQAGCDNSDGKSCLIPAGSYQVWSGTRFDPEWQPYWECSEQDYRDDGQGETSWLDCTRNGYPNNADYCSGGDYYRQCYKFSGWDAIDFNATLPSYLSWERVVVEEGNFQNNYNDQVSTHSYYLVYTGGYVSASATFEDSFLFRTLTGGEHSVLQTRLPIRINALTSGSVGLQVTPNFRQLAAGRGFEVTPGQEADLFTITILSESTLHDTAEIDNSQLAGTPFQFVKQVVGEGGQFITSYYYEDWTAAPGTVYYVLRYDGSEVGVLDQAGIRTYITITMLLSDFGSDITLSVPVAFDWRRDTQVAVKGGGQNKTLTINVELEGKRAGGSSTQGAKRVYYELADRYIAANRTRDIFTLTVLNQGNSGCERLDDTSNRPYWIDGISRGNGELGVRHRGNNNNNSNELAGNDYPRTLRISSACGRNHRNQPVVFSYTRRSEYTDAVPTVTIRLRNNNDGSTEQLFLLTIIGGDDDFDFEWAPNRNSHSNPCGSEDDPEVCDPYEAPQPNETGECRGVLGQTDGDAHPAFHFNKTTSGARDRIFRLSFVHDGSITEPGICKRTLVMQNEHNTFNNSINNVRLTLKIDVVIEGADGTRPTIPAPAPIIKPLETTPQRDNEEVVQSYEWFQNDRGQWYGIYVTITLYTETDTRNPRAPIFGYTGAAAQNVQTVWLRFADNANVNPKLIFDSEFGSGLGDDYTLESFRRSFTVLRHPAADNANGAAYVIRYLAPQNDPALDPDPASPDALPDINAGVLFTTDDGRSAHLKFRFRVRQGQIRVAGKHEHDLAFTGSTPRDLYTLTLTGGVPPYEVRRIRDNNGNGIPISLPSYLQIVRIGNANTNEYALRLNSNLPDGVTQVTLTMRAKSATDFYNDPFHGSQQNKTFFHMTLSFLNSDNVVILAGGANPYAPLRDRVLIAAPEANMRFVDANANISGTPVRGSRSPLANLNGTTYMLGGIASATSPASSTTANYLNRILSTQDGISWTEVATANGRSPLASVGGDLVAHNNRLYRFGGSYRGHGNGTTFDVHDFYSTREVWSSSDGINWSVESVLPPFSGVNNRFTPEQAQDIRATEHNGNLYVFCPQCSDWQVLESSDNGSSWQVHTANRTTESYPQAGSRSGADIVSFDGNLYIIGGSQYSNSSEPEVIVYNASESQWQTPPPPTGVDNLDDNREGANVAVVGNKMYVVGGRGSTRVSETENGRHFRLIDICEDDEQDNDGNNPGDSGAVCTLPNRYHTPHHHYTTPHPLQ